MGNAPAPVLPRYGGGALADVTPSLLAALGVPGSDNPLGIPPARAVCLLVVDGLGWQLLREHPADAPFLTSLATGSTPLTVGFPATTATSVASLGTGLPPGRHGMVGYTFAVPDPEAGAGLLNAVRWTSHGAGPGRDLRERLVPERVQPEPTVPERASAAGIEVAVAVPAQHEGSGLTRAALRGGRLARVHALGDLAAAVLTAVSGLTGARGAFCYAYHGDLDLLGHQYGPGSLAWRLQLGQVDRLVAGLAERLPPGALLAVVADHGMVAVAEEELVDADAVAGLRDGVRLLGGDVRARHVYAEPGAAADVLAAWREVLGERAWVVSGDEAVGAGWFGPVVTGRVRPRIGDVVVAARGGSGVVSGQAEPVESRLLGHHGSLTADEQFVPLLTLRG